ncbi:MarR family winged helix-turn-helix transcriptional regulator [Chitinophaga filiformis]|uniref:MarR family protein n=1 Tax=Chitinophaga filiformis TaxID=104663 RepID=A0A1G8BMG0_CHIFI|nr:MarR family transcriptional regulator [Chitinophaga filiformis]SDH34407.1 MarR family protein [Chitinophaga filiformis]
MDNVIDQSGILAISTRLQRLSDALRKEGQLIYQSFGIKFEPKWFPVVYTLHLKISMSVVEIANEIGYAHPSTISLLKELEKQQIIKSKKDKTDERKRLIVLTTKGKALVDAMKPVWDNMEKALAQIADNKNNLMEAIVEAEEKLKASSFLERSKKIRQSGNDQ